MACCMTKQDMMTSVANEYSYQPRHGVQRRMISVDIFFVFLRLLFFALLLLCVT